MTHFTRRAPYNMKPLISLITAALTLGPSLPALATPSQSPLLNQPESKPRPNIMLTLDDSGSMMYQYMPEKQATVNGVTIPMPDNRKIFLHPDEIRRNIFTDFPGMRGLNTSIDTTFVTASTNPADFANVTAPKYLDQVQMRSPQVNSIYYNPEVRYTPWKTADGQTSFPPADFNKLYLDPLYVDPANQATAKNYSSATVDLGNVIASGSSVAVTKWYCGTTGACDGYKENQTGEKANFNPGFNPAIFYMLTEGTDPSVASNYKLIDLNASASSITYQTAYAKRTDCTIGTATTVCSIAAERQNFANWFMYYRSRLMFARKVIPDTFNAREDVFRVGWATLHAGITKDANGFPSETYDASATSTYLVDGIAAKYVQQGVRGLTAEHKVRMTNWLRNITGYPYTPTKDAVEDVGNYFKNSSTAWFSKPGEQTSDPAPLSCRRTYNIVITDGYYNTDNGNANPVNVGGQDNSSVANKYVAEAPFADNANNTFADLAMKWWLTDLQPSLANDQKALTVDASSKALSAVKGDPATWQHLTQYIIGLGVKPTIEPTDANLELLSRCADVSANSLAAPGSALCWPAATGTGVVDDLWHGAVNSRGQFFPVRDPNSLENALQSILQLSSGLVAKEAGSATSIATLSAGNVKFVPQYSPVSWIGDILAYQLNVQGTVEPTSNGIKDLEGNDSGALWSAAAKRPAPDDRNIYTWSRADANTASNANPGSAVPFKAKAASTSTSSSSAAGELSDYTLGLIGTDANDVIEYIRGKDVKPAFKPHPGKLPDFVNSIPLYVGVGASQGYESLSVSASTSTSSTPATNGYTTYLKSKADRTKGVLFAGGNGGMLHAFDTSDGTEVFGYVPEAGLGKLSIIAQPEYGSSANYHQYFVDGLLTQSDAYIATSSAPAAWHNVVVGTMGAGGKALFALDVPIATPTALAAGSVLWEASGDDMGHITSEPQIGPLAQTSGAPAWKVFTGNGLESATNKPLLLTLDVATGALSTASVSTSPTDTSHTGAGLGGVALVRNKQGLVLAAYAGDSQGNLWRFEANSAGELEVGYGGTPLFTAVDGNGAAQPISAAPVVLSHPNGGQMVVFNTGQLVYDADRSSTQTQTIYGIWDKKAVDTSTSALTPPTINRDGNLVAQTVESVKMESQQSTSTTPTPATTSDANSAPEPAATTTTRTFYKLSNTPITWSASTYGWRLDMKMPDLSGTETSTTAAAASSFSFPKGIYAPQRLGQSVLIAAVKPGSTEESCKGSKAAGYGFLIKALSGAQSKLPALDANGNGTFDDDAAYGAFLSDDAGSMRIITAEGTSTKGPITECAKGSLQSASSGVLGRDCNALKIKDRIWRQLVNPPQP
jgi:type IV pilus assembly protein PilY1